MTPKFNPIQYVEDDKLPIMEVGNWAQKKYKLVGRYCDIFTKGMHNKWTLIYLDLYSGNGFAKNKYSGQIIRNSAFIALSIPQKFHHYILNDYSAENSEALKVRANRLHPNIPVKVYNCDVNEDVETLIDSIPQPTMKFGNLVFCFIDPYSLNFDFEVIKKLALRQVDILILHALQMDGRRNFTKYLDLNNERIAKFTGNPNWRDSFEKKGCTAKNFVKFISDEFDKSMNQLGYRAANRKEAVQNNSGAGIYYLCFYSKHNRGIDFFEKIRKGSNNQLEIF